MCSGSISQQGGGAVTHMPWWFHINKDIRMQERTEKHSWMEDNDAEMTLGEVEEGLPFLSSLQLQAPSHR